MGALRSVAFIGPSALVVVLFGSAMGPAEGQAKALTDGSSQTPVEKITGKVQGRIVFEGEHKPLKPLVVSTKQAQGCCAEGVELDATDRSLLVSANGGVANAVVTIKLEGRKAKPSEAAVLMDQVGCRFEPHVVVVAAGGKVSFKNSDTVSHNVHTHCFKNAPLNRTVAAGRSHEQLYDKPEAVRVACDIHPWMNSYVYVTDAAVWCLTDKDGAFELPDLPAGEYELRVWHEKLGKAKGRAVVAEDGTAAAVEIKMAPRKQKKRSRRR